MRREISWLKPSHTSRLYRGAHGNRRAAPREKPLDRRPLPPLSNERTASPLDERGTPAHLCRGVSAMRPFPSAGLLVWQNQKRLTRNFRGRVAHTLARGSF